MYTVYPAVLINRRWWSVFQDNDGNSAKSYYNMFRSKNKCFDLNYLFWWHQTNSPDIHSEINQNRIAFPTFTNNSSQHATQTFFPIQTLIFSPRDKSNFGNLCVPFRRKNVWNFVDLGCIYDVTWGSWSADTVFWTVSVNYFLARRISEILLLVKTIRDDVAMKNDLLYELWSPFAVLRFP